MRKETVATAFLIAVIIGVFYLCFLMVSPFLPAIAWALVFTIIFYPIHQRLTRAVKNVNLGAALSCLIVLGIVVLPAALVLAALIGELIDAYQLIEQRVQSGAWQLSLDPAQNRFLGRWLGWLSRHVDLSELNLRSLILDNLQRFAQLLANRSSVIVRQFSSIVFDMVLVVFTMYFLFRDAERMISKLKEMVPLPDQETGEVLHRMRETINATIYGGVAVALAQGTLGGLAFWFLGLPSPFIWGAVMFFFSFLPIVGSSLIWGPAAILLFAQGSLWKGIFLILWGVLVISMADNIIRPLVIGGRIRLHTLLIFFSILGGVKVFGFIGLIMGPVVLSVSLALIEILRRKMAPAHEQAQEPVPSTS
jgi:predicted PurR-regulated permease PerM